MKTTSILSYLSWADGSFRRTYSLTLTKLICLSCLYTLVTINLTNARPTNWISGLSTPCNENNTKVSFEANELNTLHSRVRDLAETARNHAKDIKDRFVQILKDSNFEEGLRNNRKEWTPNHQQMLAETSTADNEKDVIRTTHKYMEHYAYRWEEIVRDRSTHDLSLKKEFDEIVTISRSLLCDLSLVLSYLQIDSKKSEGEAKLNDLSTITRSLPEQLDSPRLIREYIILKDYIQSMDLLAKLFAKIKLT